LLVSNIATSIYFGLLAFCGYRKYRIMILLELAILALIVGGGLIWAAKNLSREE
jgi:hypothetical protein